MGHKELSYLLKAVDALSVLAVAFAAAVLAPLVALGATASSGRAASLAFLVCAWAGLAPLVALAVVSWRMFTDIGRGDTFTERNAARLRAMGYLCAADAAAWLAGTGVVAAMGALDPLAYLALAAAFLLAAVLAAVCAALSHLTAKAAALKAENDLTV